MNTNYHGQDLQGRLRSLPPFRCTSPGPARFDVPLRALTPSAFDAWLAKQLPPEVRTRFHRVFADARALAEQGLADPAPPLAPWLLHVTKAWLHSEDMQVIMTALGHAKALAGVHDLTETARGRHIKQQLVRQEPWWIAAGMHRVDPWYRRWAQGLHDDDDVNIGYLNPHLAASFFRRGLNPSGPANASSAHLLSDHHFGSPDKEVDLVEQAVNWVVHQLPREHLGVHHTALKPWSALDVALQTDAQARASSLLRQLAADIAPVMAELERSGHVVPWHRVSPSS